MKKFAIAAVATVFALALSLQVGGAVEPPSAPIKVTNHGKGKVVTFDHSVHKDKVESCERCHHKAAEGKYKCGECHKAEKEDSAPSLKDAAHDKVRGCWSCHAKGAEHEKKCTECHKG